MWIDIERVYDMEKINSTDIKTHMQTDKISVDFGFITNAGRPRRQTLTIKYSQTLSDQLRDCYSAKTTKYSPGYTSRWSDDNDYKNLANGALFWIGVEVYLYM